MVGPTKIYELRFEFMMKLLQQTIVEKLHHLYVIHLDGKCHPLEP
jgi:hypothetical protein